MECSNNNDTKVVNKMKTVAIIAAYDKKTKVIGYTDTDGPRLPWNHIKEDMKSFRDITTKTVDSNKRNAVIMGYNTWLSIGQKRLSKRYNVIVSRSKSADTCFRDNITQSKNDCLLLGDLNMAIEVCMNDLNIESIFIIGGAEIYKQAIVYDCVNTLYITEVDMDNIFKVNNEITYIAYFPRIPSHFKIVSSQQKNDIYPLTFIKYEDMREYEDPESDEMCHLNVLKKILKYGSHKPDRTGTGVLSLISEQIRFKLYRENSDKVVFPLLTTKKMFVKGIIEELLMFINGDVNTNKLREKGVKIWEGNTTREFLDNNGMKHIESGSLGKGYSFQWRAWGAKYKSIDTDHKKEPGAIDQLQNVINLLHNDPFSRRIIINAWNVSDLKEMALPPCHVMYQFIVDEEQIDAKNTNIFDIENPLATQYGFTKENNQKVKRLNCVMTQRSADMFLGVPFNICTTALLTILLAKLVGMVPGEIVINLADAHIYKNAIEQCQTQIERTPYLFPTIEIKKELNNIEDLEKLTFEDFVINDYKCHPAIKANMAI